MRGMMNYAYVSQFLRQQYKLHNFRSQLHYYNMSINRRPVNVTFTYTPTVRPVQHNHKYHANNQSLFAVKQRPIVGYSQGQPMQRLSSTTENAKTYTQHSQYLAQPPLQIKVSSDKIQQNPLEAITRNLITQVTKSISEITKAQIDSFKSQKPSEKQIGFKSKISIKKPLTKQFVKQKFAQKFQSSEKRFVNRYSSLQSPKRALQKHENEESNFLFQLFNLNKRQNKSQMKDFISTNWKQSNQPSLKQVENNASQDTTHSKLLKEMVKQLKHLNQNKKESRTVELQINFDECPSDDKKRQRDHFLKEAIAKIISTVISVGFNMHYKQGIQFQKVKAYCSQNFLSNFCKLVTITKLNRRQMKVLEQHLQEDVLPYLNLSYPRSEQKQINRQLKSKIDEKDTFNQNRFDIVYNSKVPMSIKGKDNNAEIMKIMNYIIQLPDEKVISNQLFTNETIEYQPENKTLYEMFEEDMAAILNRVYRRELVDKLCKLNTAERFKIRDAILEKKQSFATSKQLMEEVDQQIIKFNTAHLKFINEMNEHKNSQNQFTSSQIQFCNNLFSNKTLRQSEYKTPKSKLYQNKDKQQLEYKDKVQSYTKFKIGRKIESNVQPYTQQEIEEGALIIKDSSVARVLMKWVQALETQIQDPSKNTYGRDQPYRLNNQEETYLLSQQAEISKLYNFYDRSANVVKEQSQILKNNAREIFLQALKSADLKKFKSYRAFSSQRDAKIGHICTLLEKCKENHISSYLNMVLNQIKYIEQQYQDLIFDKQVALSSRPSLITMKLGDLMRCQVTSKPKEIVALYQYICLLCKTSINRFQLVRVKDRLNTTNKDILLNIFYHKKIMIEIQLAIKNESAFISCSDKFSHFLYEMMRAFLGPINEICSIWSHYSPKAPFFVQKFQQINIRAQQTFSPSCTKDLNHEYEDDRKGFKLPFWCSTCGILYHNDSVIRKICRHCKIYKCGICEIKANSRRYIEVNYPNYQLITIPQVGKIFYALDIGTNHVHIKTMMKVEMNGKIEVFSMKIDPQLRSSMNISDDESQGQLFSPLISNIKSQYEIIKRKKKNQADLNRQLFEQTHIILGKKDALQDDQQYEEVLTNQIVTKIVSEYYLSSRMKSIAKKYRRFLKLSIITNPPLPLQRKSQLINTALNRNQKALGLMEKLNLNENGLSTLDIANKMHLLRGLALCNNRLSSLSLEGFQNLAILELSSNKISKFSQLKFLHKCKNLKKLFLDSNTINSLQGLPQQLHKLQILSLKKNYITALNHLPKLASLVCLNLNQNKVNALNGIEKIKGLQQLRLKANSFIGSKGVEYLKELKQLKKLDLSVTNLSKTLCQSMALGRDGRLQQIFIQTAPMSALQFQPLMALNTLMHLQQLDLSSNFLKFIPQISKLKDLKELNLSHNTLQTVKNLQIFNKLVWLNLKQNKINNLDGLGSLRNLKWLDLSQNAIQSKWLCKISELANLQQLELSQNELTTMEGIGRLKNLIQLSFRNNYITNLKGIQKLIALEHLDASQNKLVSLAGIENLSLLIKLKLSNNIIASYKQLENVQNLKILQLNWVGLSSIQQIPKIKNLQQLYLNHNQLKTLKGIQNFQSLKKLQIKFNPIGSIEQIKQLKFLGFFSFTINQHLKVAILAQLETLQMVKIHKKKGQEPPFEQQQILIGMVLMGCQVQYEEM